MRGRNRSNKGPNPLTRAYESNGPDVKIRGTAQHIAEKYAQLARDAQASGDPVMAENYFQHGEHYQRIIAAANEQYRQQFGGMRQPFDDEDEGDDEAPQTNGYAAGPDNRGGNGYSPNGYGHGDDYVDPAQQPQPYETRGERDDRPPRYDRQQDRRDRFQNRDRPQRQDRQQDRSDRQGEPRQDFRGDHPRQDGPRQDGPRQDGPRHDGPRERGEFRRERPERPRREEPRAELPVAEEPGLPAFLTNPVRPAPAPAPVPPPPPAPPAIEEPAPVSPAAEAAEAPARPRRRRRTRYEGQEGGVEGGDPSAPKAPVDAPSE
ncbi:DUF4167 domain-containing protein [Methylobacterium sp. ID0610]|uniref:DUF4167 domain-containing protein n=1 Tax=Methylobacterium carpenticola TaxID=3344827 RepID=UPI0036BFC2F4